MLDKIEEIYEYLDSYCIGMDLTYGFKFKRYVLQETNSFTSFHMSMIVGEGFIHGEDRISGIFIVTVYKDYIAVNVLKKLSRFSSSGHDYESFLVRSVEDFQDVFINNMDKAISSIAHLIHKDIV